MKAATQSVAVIIAFRKSNKRRVIFRRFWPRRYPYLTPRDFYLWLISKDKVYETNPHTPEELTSAARFPHFPGKNSGLLITACSTGILSTFGKEGNIFSVYFNSGEFLLDFLKITVMIHCVATFTGSTRHAHMTQCWKTRRVAAVRSNTRVYQKVPRLDL